MDTDNEILLLEKGKRGIRKMLFGRTGLMILLLLIQFIVMAGIFYYLGNFIHLIYGLMSLFSFCMVVYIINRDEDTTVKLTWIIIIMLVPAFGSLFYLYVQLDIGHSALKKRVQQIIDESKDKFEVQKDVMEELKESNKNLYNLASYISKTGGFPIYKNTSVKYFPLGENKFKEMLKQLEKAEKFILLEYFIVDEGFMWGSILKVLAKKVKEGVEVKMMYDGTCEFSKLPHNYPKKLKKLGIECKMFAPITPFLSTHYNYRDHRKILVIDGHTAFTGGVNLADEYINKKEVFGHWKDNAIMIRGAAVRSFTIMFLQMWHIDEKQIDYDRYLSNCNVKEEIDENCKQVTKLHNGYVMPYGDSPLDNERVGEMVYMDILNNAKDYVYIYTPYLILDGTMIIALQFAAKRGVKVKLILPHIPDKKYAFALAKSHYYELISSGVEIYEYTPGFVHAKTFVSDDRKAVVGTINLDYRSLYHHFECATYMEDVSEIFKIKNDIKETLKKCQRITLEDVHKENILMKISGKVLKFVAPLM